MNWRLVSDQQKAFNKHERWRRDAKSRAQKRRDAALQRLRDPFRPMCRGVISAQDAFDLIYGDVKGINRVVGRLNRSGGLEPANGAESAGGDIAIREIPQPSRTLRRANRGSVSPLITKPTITYPADFVGLERALEIASDLARQRVDRAQILQFLASPDTTGLAPKVCVELAAKVGLKFTAAEIESVEHAVTNNFISARRLYRAMVAAGELGGANGEWGFFENAALHAALPGLRLPHVLRRDQFLVRIKYRNDQIVCLDLHSSSYRPLCRHPVD